MVYSEVHVFSSAEYPRDDAPPMVRPVIEDLYIWFSKSKAYIFVNGWTPWEPGQTIHEVLHG